VGNPLDSGWGGVASPETYLDCVRTMLAEEQFDLLLLQEELPRAPNQPQKESNLAAANALAAEADKPIVFFSMVSHAVTDHGRVVRARCPNVAFVQEVEKSLRAVRHLTEYAAARARRGAAPARRSPAGAAAPLGELLALGRAVGERETKAVLAGYGLSVVAEEVAGSEAEAVAAAERVGYPVVLKVWSPDILHKTEVGGVRVGLTDADAVRAAFGALQAAAAARPGARFEGVLVQPQVSGVEVLIGVHQDPQFGPVIVFGAGGVLTEVLGDVSLRLPPLDLEGARAAIAATRVATVLEGVRGRGPADVEVVADALVRVGELAVDAGPALGALDINPLIVGPAGRGAWVVDALLIGSTAPTPRPSPNAGGGGTSAGG
jgi:acetyltransferase